MTYWWTFPPGLLAAVVLLIAVLASALPFGAPEPAQPGASTCAPVTVATAPGTAGGLQVDVSLGAGGRPGNQLVALRFGEPRA